MSDKRSTVPIPLHNRKGFTHNITKLCNHKIEQYVTEHGELDICDFSASFNPFNAAQELYRTVPNIEKYNTENAKKLLFIQQIAYAIDRRMPYHLYAKHMRLRNLEPKPLKNYAHHIFPKDAFKESSAKYTYKINEEELVKAYKFHMESSGLIYLPVSGKPAHKKYYTDEAAANKPRNKNSPYAGKKNRSCKKTVKRHKNIIPSMPSIINPVHTIMKLPDGSKMSGCFAALKMWMEDKQIIEFMESRGWPEADFAVMKGDKHYIMKYCPELLEDNNGSDYRKDYRDNISYLQNLVSTWIFENIIAGNINKAGGGKIFCSLNGTDKSREILTHVTQKPDFMVSCNGIEKQMELSMSHTGLFYYDEIMHLRGHKRENIIKENAISLAVETFLLDSNRTHSLDMCKIDTCKNRGWLFSIQDKDDLSIFKRVGKDRSPFKKECDAVYLGMETFHSFHEFVEILIKKMYEYCGIFNREWEYMKTAIGKKCS